MCALDLSETRISIFLTVLAQELRMRMGSKKIYHLEAWVVKIMCLYKVCDYTCQLAAEDD